MKKNNKSMLFLVAVCACLAASCDKETITLNEKVKNDNQIETKDIVKFDNMDEYTKVLDSVLSMNDLELKLYEESMGYKSFGRECDEFYENIDFEKFTTQEELLSFVDNSDYLVITEDEEGELYIETPFSTNYRRYLMNKDRLFMIGETYYKVFEDGVISAEKDDLEELREIKTNKIGAIESTHSLQVEKIQREIKEFDSKDDAYNCGLFVEKKETRNRDRTRVQISLESTFKYNNGPHTDVVLEFIVRPLKKHLGAWIYCSRTISGNISIAIDIDFFYSINGVVWQREIITASNPGTGDSKWRGSYPFLIPNDLRNGSHIAGYKGWAETPSAPRVVLERNVELF